jgi:cell division cycle protein 20 (cofactor of APC complex)
MSNFLNDVVELESLMALDNPVKSSTATRWERKARQAQVQQLSSSQPSQCDRYIPNRSGMEFDINHLVDENKDSKNDHSKLLTGVLEDDNKGSRVLAFKSKAPAPADGYQSSLRVLYSAAGPKKEVVKPTRQIASAPFRVLDAPDMLDDYCKSVFK